jgi:DNA primase
MMTLLELLSCDTELRKVANLDGGEYAGPCPWCGGRDRFRVWPYADKPRYWCRQCGKQGDAIEYLRDREGLTFRQACERLGEPLPERSGQRSTPMPPPLAKPPSHPWQACAQVLIERCEHTLWTPAGAQARLYLHRRGLTDETIREARLGYHATEQWENPERWGLSADHNKIHLLHGIVFPWQVGSEVWKVTFRQDGKDIPKDQRYRQIGGGGNMLYQINALRPNAPTMLVEGELDALSIMQEASDLLAVVATGSTAGGRRERWIGRLALCSIVLVSFDADVAGEEAAAWWLKALGPRAKRWRPYWDDANAMLQGGVDLRTWVREGLGLSPQWWREVARWPEDRRERWEERAAIMEMDGGLVRDGAELAAYLIASDAKWRE